MPVIKKIQILTIDLPEAFEKASQSREPLVIRSRTSQDLRIVYKNELNEIVVLEVEEEK